MIDVTAADGITADLERVADQLRRANLDVGRTLAPTVKRLHLEAARAMRGTLTMSRMRVKLNANTRVYAGPQVSSVVVTPKPAGPWAIVEDGTKGHMIRARQAEALGVPSGPLENVEVSGVPGRQIWSRALEAATPGIDEHVRDLFDEALGG